MTELEELTELNKKQAHEIEILKEQIQILTKRLFGTSSEKSSKVDPGQLSIFDENSPFFKNQR